MNMNELYPPSEFANDSRTHRTCGDCMNTKPIAEFYKDGVDASGNTKYRRNCKECYRVSRMKAERRRRKKK